MILRSSAIRQITQEMILQDPERENILNFSETSYPLSYMFLDAKSVYDPNPYIFMIKEELWTI